MDRMKLRLSRELRKVHQMIRVNHAGEFGAERIYKGQLAVLRDDPEIKVMLEQEMEHLKYFESQVLCRRVRPTLLQPIWHIGGFALGAITAFIGREAAMACTVAVEEVIAEHYGLQLKELDAKESDLSEHIEKFRLDEMEHYEHGIDAGAEVAPCYGLLKAAIVNITKAAIFLSKRL